MIKKVGLKPFFKNKTNLILAILLTTFFILIAFFSVEGFHWKDSKYTGDAITSDELSHIPSGYYYLKTGRYFINPEHPPIVKDIAGLPLLLLKPILPEISDKINLGSEFTRWDYPFKSYVMPKNLEIGNSQWDWGRLFLFNPNNDPDNISYVIPGNDDSTRAIRFFAKTMADTIIEARASVMDEVEVKDEFVEVKESASEAPAEVKSDSQSGTGN